MVLRVKNFAVFSIQLCWYRVHRKINFNVEIADNEQQTLTCRETVVAWKWLLESWVMLLCAWRYEVITFLKKVFWMICLENLQLIEICVTSVTLLIWDYEKVLWIINCFKSIQLNRLKFIKIRKNISCWKCDIRRKEKPKKSLTSFENDPLAIFHLPMFHVPRKFLLSFQDI